MEKIIILFVSMSLVFFGSLHSASFECNYASGGWGTLGTIYECSVPNSVSITTLDAAQVDSISGTHKAGYNNENVEVFQVTQGQIHYFPRGLNKFFKNLKGIQIGSNGLKEVHQSDLKDFPKLVNLYLYSSNLEILEQSLFEFNPNMEYIYLGSNKITHIDPKVFDKLTKLKYLYLDSNTCINMAASNNPTQLQNVIKAAKAQCTNSGFSNLEQKVKSLEIESKNLNSENFKQKLENLENELKSSKFPNFFQQKLQDLKADQVKKAQETTTTTQKPTTTTTTAITTTTEAPKKTEVLNFETCSALESKIEEISANLIYCVDQAVNGTNTNKVDNDHQQNEQCASIKEDLRNQAEAMGTRMEILEENVENFKMSALREILNIKNAVKDAHHGLMMSMNFKAEKMEKQIKNIEEQIKEQIKEQNRKFEENFAIILKALKIDD